MNEVFGLPMSGIMATLIALLSLCLLSVAWVAWRRPVIFKLGVRNIPRRRAQTALIVVGLMLSTLIISTALGVGDTLDYSATSDTYRQLGRVDAVVVQSRSPEADLYAALDDTFGADALAVVERATAGIPEVDGLLPILDARVPVRHDSAGQGEPTAILTGIDPARLDAFGGLRGTDGNAVDLAAFAVNEVAISEEAAKELDAAAGDTVTAFFANKPLPLTVAAVVEDSTLAGHRETAVGLVMPLAQMQALTGQPDTVSMIAVSGAGGVRDAADGSESAVAALRSALAGQNLGVDPIKADMVEQAEGIAALFTGLFLVLGLFSIAAGVLLIVLIFTMLAAERRSEMGMARAVGTQRKQLIQQFVAEGSGYALLSGLVGAALGVGAAFGIAAGLRALFGDFLAIEPHVEPRSLVVAYCLGVVITFLAVVGSSWKISRLNVVAAVRDIPDVATGHRRKRTLVWGALLLGLGGLLAIQGAGAGVAFPFYAGMSLLPFGIALPLRFFGVASRPVFSAAGLYLLALWMLPQNAMNALVGELDGEIEMFFLSGIFMVVGATMVILQNTDLLLAGVSRLGGLFKGSLPAVRTAVAYPGAARGRTGLTIAMFSLIVFSLVMVATMNHNYTALYLGDEATAGWDVRADASNANPLADFRGDLAAQGVAAGEIAAVGVVASPGLFGSEVRLAGAPDWKNVDLRGMDPAFLDGSEFAFLSRAVGYADDAAVVAALRADPTLAVIDASALDGGGGFEEGSDDRFVLSGVGWDDETFAPRRVELARADGGISAVTIVGVIDEKVGALAGLFTARDTVAAVAPDPALISYYVRLADPDRADAVAQEIEAALLQNGVEGVSLRGEVEDQQRQSSGFLYLVQGFMGLGLLVGVAAVGVIAFRSVVERRQQIGVLRAIGYRRGLVSLSFLIETAFIVGMGVLSGTILGVVLARNLFTADDAADGAGFSVPWPVIATILVATVAIALVMTWVPSRQAARIAPAEALRYE
ncbi:MAG: ABC transporter, fused permease protein [uncultured Thermomicrobiales bacterium]|uniref:ABC transporter, fused permease protein n=1 Tax=uncultured Thermomicrobiales bacterium TaxID=1645740 RepID=A0A6J4V3P0_9BACT|nr:MAG: ABC transporter, fused permease protein [uncultured Thermomicrobiales bacterium]